MAGLKLKLNLKQPKDSGNSRTSSLSPNKRKSDSQSISSFPTLKIKPPKRDSDNGSKPKRLKINFKNPNLDKDRTIIVGGVKKKKPPKVRIKPTRVPGDGYDSETPDLEDDPLIERGIVVRFLDDSNLDTVHNAVESNDLSGINIEWISKSTAIVKIYESTYLARLIDLPTLTEIYKTLDKKNIYKILDICEILMVIKLINYNDYSDSDFDIPNDKLYNHVLYKYSRNHEIVKSKDVLRDGLSTPFENVYRRFKPRKLNHRLMEDIDARVDELIKLDNEAMESHFEIVDPTRQQYQTPKFSSTSPPPPSTESQFKHVSTGEDQTLEQNYLIGQNGLDTDNHSDNELEVELAEALGNDGVELDELIGQVGTPAEEEDEEEEDEEDDGDDGVAVDNEDEDEDEEDEEEDEDNSDEDEDEEGAKSDNQQVKLLVEEISDLERAVESHKKGLEAATHKMMKMKFQNNYNTLKASLDSKKRELAKLMDGASDEVPKNFEEEDDDEEEDEEEGEGEDFGTKEETTQREEGDDEAGFDDLDDLF